MSGWVAGATALGALVSGGIGLMGQQQQAGYQGSQLAQAQANYQLQKQAQEFQQRLATGSRTDSLGNKVYWDGTGWKTETTPGTLGVLLASQANERMHQTAGGIRSELGQENNFARRGDAGVAADSALRNYANNAGRPTLEGVQSRDTIARATQAGGSRSALTDAVARNVLRSGGNPVTGARSLDAVNAEGRNNLTGAIAGAQKDSPGEFLNQDQAWGASNMNKIAPLSSIAGNVSDTAVAPSNAGAPVDAMLGQAATYGAATAGRGSAATNAANAGILDVKGYQPNYGGTASSMMNAVLQLIKSGAFKGIGSGMTSSQVGGPDGFGGLGDVRF